MFMAQIDHEYYKNICLQHNKIGMKVLAALFFTSTFMTGNFCKTTFSSCRTVYVNCHV